MDDAHEERFQQHEALMGRLALILETQHERNLRQDIINERLTDAIERLDRTQARIETLLARMMRQADNGRDA